MRYKTHKNKTKKLTIYLWRVLILDEVQLLSLLSHSDCPLRRMVGLTKSLLSIQTSV